MAPAHAIEAPRNRLVRAARRWWVNRRIRDCEQELVWVQRHLDDDLARQRLLNHYLAELRVQQATLQETR